jgi:UDP-glucose 4-epimerase
MKKRVVVFGASGFVGSAIFKQLDQAAYHVIGLSHKDCDLSDEKSHTTIQTHVQDGDIVVCAAAKAPAKNWDMLTENITIITHFIEGLRGKKISYLLNISSDAVYADSMEKLHETSLIAPTSPHGIMHCMREHLLERNITAAIGHLRPTLIYGEADPHNGYGPNSFLRSAKTSQKIELFGNGEEQRDHIFVGDVAKLACAMIAQKTTGAINAVSGNTISFMDIAKYIQQTNPHVEISSKPRTGPMPHNGYRAFSSEAAKKLLPNLTPQDLGDYLRLAARRNQHAA